MKRLIALGIFGVFLFFSVTLWAQVPQLLNYQGRLTDATGSPITTTTGVRFSIYQGGDATTAGSGTLVYEEYASISPDSNGVFDHMIGTGTIIYGSLNMAVFNTAQPVYLEIGIDPLVSDETLLPRKLIVTVGYSFISELAYDADTVDGQDASAFAPVVHNHDPDYVNEGQADSVTSAMIVDGTIVDADINAGANIAASKIDPTGLDADLLDGKDSEAFVHTTGDDMTGTLSVIATGSLYSLYGKDENTSGITYGVFGESSSTNGRGIFGLATATSGTNRGIYGRSYSTEGYGVYGWASATSGTTYGLHGRSDSTEGYGVYGVATTTSGTNYGVLGKSNSPGGYGVRGIAPNYGVYGEATATGGYAVYGTAPFYGVHGHATGTSGGTLGVFGRSDSTSGYGVYGEATANSGTNYGVYGQSDSTNGRGVCGLASATSGLNYGVYGEANSESGYGVYGYASASSGYTSGVVGVSESTYGTGVSGYASASSGTNYGVYGETNSSSGYAGYFEGRVHVDGNFTVSGSKTCVQPIDNGKKVLLYAMESPEIWFEDFGTAELVNGQAVVQIESIFAQTANTEAGYMVFLTPIGEWKGLYIFRKDKDSFEVRELGDGKSNISFDYRIVAKRRGYEEVRFEEFTEPEKPPAEPNLPIEKK